MLEVFKSSFREETIFLHYSRFLSCSGGYNDVALLRTARRIEFNEGVFPFCISDSRPSPQTTVIGAGFGYVNESKFLFPVEVSTVIGKV